MKKITTSTGFNTKLHLHILKTMLFAANVLVIFLHVFIHVVFYDFPFVWQEEVPVVFSLIAYASLVATGISFLMFAVDGTQYLVKNRKSLHLPRLFPVHEG